MATTHENPRLQLVMKSGAVGREPAPAEVCTAATYAERYAAGKALRKTCPRKSHAAWKPAVDRPDPVHLILEAEKNRIPDLLPLRHGRMVRSPFTFYRGPL